MDEEITTNIPVSFVGVAPAVKELGGMLITHLDEIEVKCLPNNLIHTIEVNIEPLIDFHSSILVSDLVVPDTIKVLNNLEDVVVTAVAPRQEEETTEAPSEDSEVPADSGSETNDSQSGDQS
jgi:large subunit ribosomal protein L25